MKRKKGERMENRKLKGKLLELKKTYKDASEILGISETSFSSKINGLTAFTLPEVLLLCEWLDLENSEKIQIFLDQNLSDAQKIVLKRSKKIQAKRYSQTNK